MYPFNVLLDPFIDAFSATVLPKPQEFIRLSQSYSAYRIPAANSAYERLEDEAIINHDTHIR
jgi:hypothetical protein